MPENTQNNALDARLENEKKNEVCKYKAIDTKLDALVKLKYTERDTKVNEPTMQQKKEKYYFIKEYRSKIEDLSTKLVSVKINQEHDKRINKKHFL